MLKIIVRGWIWKKFAIPSAMQRNMHSMPSLIRDRVSNSVLHQVYSVVSFDALAVLQRFLRA